LSNLVTMVSSLFFTFSAGFLTDYSRFSSINLTWNALEWFSFLLSSKARAGLLPRASTTVGILTLLGVNPLSLFLIWAWVSTWGFVHRFSFIRGFILHKLQVCMQEGYLGYFRLPPTTQLIHMLFWYARFSFVWGFILHTGYLLEVRMHEGYPGYFRLPPTTQWINMLFWYARCGYFSVVSDWEGNSPDSLCPVI